MKEVNVTELRQNLPGYLAKVRRGDRIRVTSRLTLRAKLVTADQRLRASPRAVTVW
jgi:prevent-host-death family protein